ncbi:unnamed protein product [Medioppia subpectinata]|uniref:Cytochrome P450 n=1 Tax=Medioppia subpectinata TaxID=1979941 RepID=A0A7R9KSN6_9ACAR|nr:unnamed protein product [Medioppia subpectinata]CAG2109094.1 unnamed protein product [Medioppia subpectinata]
MLAAGHETTASQLCLITRILALKHWYQTKLVHEIHNTLYTKDTNELSMDYDKLQKMPFLDAFIKEVMRINCSITRIERHPTIDTHLEGIYLPKGTPIIIPIWALHLDPDNFSDPLEFKPERFLPENLDNIKPYTYLPFSTGPRNCIGLRFAILELKYTLVKLLCRYEFVPCNETKIFGTGKPLPDTNESITAYCNKLGYIKESSNKLAVELQGKINIDLSLKPAVREILLTAAKPEFYERFMILCKMDRMQAIKVIKGVNQHMRATKAIKWDAIGHMLEALEPNSKMTLAHILCIARTYITVTIRIHDDIDGVQEYVRNRLSYFLHDVEKAEQLTKVNAEWECDFHEYKKNELPYESFSYVFVKVLEKLIQ